METPRHDIIKEHKLGRFGQPEEIASAAPFLLSADASFITGHALVVDGGSKLGASASPRRSPQRRVSCCRATPRS